MNDDNSLHHQSVLYSEVIDQLALVPEGVYIDATFGRGGHSRGILLGLGSTGRLIALDRDPEAISYAQSHFSDPRFEIVHSSFSCLQDIVAAKKLTGQVNGILLDLGVSSPQLDDPDRGFSFLRDGPLDMRMDCNRGQTAAQWLAVAEAREIVRVLREYGEERFAKRIASAIVAARAESEITRTGQLAEIIADAVPTREQKKHPATRSFQAIRIFINEELHELTQVLEQCLEVLAIGGRLVVISFHSLEDRIVKRFMRKQASCDNYPKDLPIQAAEITPRMRVLGKAIRADEAELQGNIRSRSAVLRVAEKLS